MGWVCVAIETKSGNLKEMRSKYRKREEMILLGKKGKRIGGLGLQGRKGNDGRGRWLERRCGDVRKEEEKGKMIG